MSVILNYMSRQLCMEQRAMQPCNSIITCASHINMDLACFNYVARHKDVQKCDYVRHGNIHYVVNFRQVSCAVCGLRDLFYILRLILAPVQLCLYLQCLAVEPTLYLHMMSLSVTDTSPLHQWPSTGGTSCSKHYSI